MNDKIASTSTPSTLPVYRRHLYISGPASSSYADGALDWWPGAIVLWTNCEYAMRSCAVFIASAIDKLFFLKSLVTVLSQEFHCPLRESFCMFSWLLQTRVCRSQETIQKDSHRGHRNTWLKTVTRDFKKNNLSIAEAINTAQYRIAYSQLVHSTMAPGHQSKAPSA